MTNDTGSTNQGSGKDPVAGKGQPRSEGESLAPDTTDSSAEGGETASTGDGKQDPPEQHQDEPPPKEEGNSEDFEGDDPLDPEVLDNERRAAAAEAAKATQAATVDLYSTAPDKKKARETLTEDYRKAMAPGGELALKFGKADERFMRTAREMSDVLEAWIERNFESGERPLGAFLEQRAQVGYRLQARAGLRERKRAETQETAKRWAEAFAAWSTPVARMSALIGEYTDKIEKLNADISNEINLDQAIFVFWFEIAPKHLQLRTEELDDPVKQEVADLMDALGPDTDLAKRLLPGEIRDDGSLYLIEPDDLEQRRKDVLKSWEAAALAAGEAEAEFRIRRDDAGALRQRWDKLKGDAWIKDAAAILDRPATKP